MLPNAIEKPVASPKVSSTENSNTQVSSTENSNTLEKPEVVARAAQLQSLEAEASKNVDLLESKKMAERDQPPSATVVTTSTVNNTTKETKISPPVRNVDTTFNDRLGMSFGY
jgi:hypothetical protein